MAMGVTRDLGPCRILFGDVDLGPTFGNVEFKYSEEDAGVYEDQLGTTEVDDIAVGSRCELTAPFTRTQLAILAALIAGASGSGTSGDQMTVKQVVGQSRYDRAKELIVKPVLLNGSADPDTSRWLHIFKASPRADVTLTYNNADQRVYNMLFKGYPDQTATGIAAYRVWKLGA